MSGGTRCDPAPSHRFTPAREHLDSCEECQATHAYLWEKHIGPTVNPYAEERASAERFYLMSDSHGMPFCVGPGGGTRCEDACSICGGPNASAFDGEGWCDDCDSDARLAGDDPA